MSGWSHARGKDFERRIEEFLRTLESNHPTRVSVRTQVRTKLFDGRTKILDFALAYILPSVVYHTAIEVQDRQRWSSPILDKILAVRNHSSRNRFWFIYKNENFLTPEGRSLLNQHGIMKFSLNEFERHLAAIDKELKGLELLDFSKNKSEDDDEYDPPIDQSMLSR